MLGCSVFHVDLGISHRTAAVAGASSGLGFASAMALAQEGVRVAICSRDATRVADAAKLIGSSCIGVVADVSTMEGGQDFVRQATNALGHIDILVANGGGPPAGNFATTPADLYIEGLQQSLLSVVGMCTEVVSEMQSRGWGRIVAITSVAVRQPIPNLILSNTARAGVTGFLKTLAREVAASGITVNSVQPGIHSTDRIRQLYGSTPDASTLGIPAGVVGNPTDFGALVTFLCSESAKFITGTSIQVDGGAYTGLL
jgi:3-oxoacyl-[acyl-carrier protein] reductase